MHEVLQRVETVPDELVDLVVARADGNAFYVEELIKMLIDNGVIITSPDDDVWLVDLARLEPGAMPSTLTGVLQARLDTLDAADRRALQCAAVVGRVFWDDAVSAVTGDDWRHAGRTRRRTFAVSSCSGVMTRRSRTPASTSSSTRWSVT